MSNVCAGIGRGQLEVIEERVAQRRANFQFYSQHLTVMPGVSFQIEQNEVISNRWLSTMLTNNSPSKQLFVVNVIDALNNKGIESRPVWKPMHLQSIFIGQKYFGGNTSQMLFEQGICLPSGTDLCEHNIKYIAETIVGYSLR
jgi:dTDP-4-amino-4,6-dideoxygalactose transaminase